MRRLTTEEFIERAVKLHGDKYSYDNAIYEAAQDEIEIICNKCCNHFWTTPNNHTNSATGGRGCPECNKGVVHTKEKFISNAIEKYGDDFLYDRVVYINARTQVEIFCKKHDYYFKTVPDTFINRSEHGCRKCAFESTSNINSKSSKLFLEQANEIHGGIFKYDLTNYKNNRVKINIICEKHGPFPARPKDHIIKKQGCPICKSSRGENNVTSILKDLMINFNREYKFESCINYRKLPFDFAILNKNLELKGLIEFHGIQHFESIEYFGGEERFMATNRNDQIKADFCVFNKIPFLVIPYYNEDKIRNIIDIFLRKIKNKKSIIEFRRPNQLNIFQV